MVQLTGDQIQRSVIRGRLPRRTRAVAVQHETLPNTELVPVVISRKDEGACLAM